MKTIAAILLNLKCPLELVDLELPKLKPHQVLVRIHVSGVCGSQIGEIDGVKGPDPYLPHCLGHEAGATVEEVGPGVKKTRRGDRVVLHWRPGTGCDAEPALYRWGRRTVRAGRVTTFQRHAVVSENRLTVVPASVPMDVAAMYGCAVTTGFGIVTRDARVQKGETVLVLGAGGVGQIEIIAARNAGAGCIIATDLHSTKLKLAIQNGAHYALKAGKGLEVRMRKILRGRVPDVVLENTGRTDLIESAYEWTGPNGRTILVGVPRAGDKAHIDTLPLHFGKVLTGSHGGGARPQEDIPGILKWQRRTKWSWKPLMSSSYTLERINDAIRDLRQGRALRPMIRMDLGVAACI
jgi:S-(hydroxymethyl)glutathione dehydrogenase/alcohol dehydrogenase